MKAITAAIFFWCFFLIIFVPKAKAQQGLLQLKSLKLSHDTIKLDSLAIVPSSFQLQVDGVLVDTADYELDEVQSLLILRNKSKLLGKEATASYNTLPIDFTKVYRNKDESLINPSQVNIQNPFIYKGNTQNAPLGSFGTLDKQGSISRGINVGNNQNLGVNSNLNLQLSGKITEEIGILAAITDENIPIQPEGNTQTLQDFDQVYIQVFDDKNKLTAGDFTLQNPDSYFMRYQKRAQGGSFKTAQLLQNKAKLNVQGSAAVSRGKFGRNIVQGVEGNQGPYRLRGAENEPFIIILSGTERVYIDGKLLTRGQEYDYIINYNTAELIFTAKQFITKDKRIIVEFQYADQNYARSLFQVSTSYQHKKWKIDWNFYSEQDSKNQPLQQEIDDQRRFILQNVGDSLQNALVGSVENVGFDETQIRYALKDSLTPYGYFDSILVFSIKADEAVYSAQFSNVGQGNGLYRISDSRANGRVYEWVGLDPNTLQPLGSFMPKILLISPKQRQMMTLGTSYSLNKNSKVIVETALTKDDINTFSELDSGDDYGYALNAKWINEKPLKQDSAVNWKLNSLIGLERWSENFKEIEWIRSPEFYRNWNLPTSGISQTQDLMTAQVGIAENSKLNVMYRAEFYNIANDFTGIKNSAIWSVNTSGWLGGGEASFLNSSGGLGESSFQRRQSLLKRRLAFLNLGYRDDYENNQRILSNTDTLSLASYRFYEWEAFVETADTSGNKYKLSYTRRTDEGPRNNEFSTGTLGQSIAFDFELSNEKQQALLGKIAYRTLDILDSGLASNQEPENTLVGRLEYRYKAWKGALSSSSFYEIGSGLEARQNFVYLEVAPGQGNYTWRDYNGNGLREIDEFEVAAFQDEANFIKIFVPSDDYVRIFTNQFSQNIALNPAAVWRNSSGFKKFIARFSDQMAYRIDRKTNNEQLLDRFNPFAGGIADTALISLNSSFRNTFYFNRTNPVFGADFNVQRISGKSLLLNGFQSTDNDFMALGFRWNIKQSWIVNGSAKEGIKLSSSDFLTGRNFEIVYYELSPKLTFQPGTKFRVTASFDYSEKQNTESLGGEKAIVRKSGVETKYNEVGKGSVQANINYILISYNGAVNNALGFEMLEALQPGNNATWGLNYQRTFKNNLQLNINYNGRSSETANTVHAGGVQVRAFF